MDKLKLLAAIAIFSVNAYANDGSGSYDVTVKKTCDLPKDAWISYGIPVREDKQYYLGLLKYNGSQKVLLIDLGRSISNCPNRKDIIQGNILSRLPVNIQPNDESRFINLECAITGTKHHYLGIVKQRRFTTKYVAPEQAWEVDLNKGNIAEVDARQVQCFVGGYD